MPDKRVDDAEADYKKAVDGWIELQEQPVWGPAEQDAQVRANRYRAYVTARDALVRAYVNTLADSTKKFQIVMAIFSFAVAAATIYQALKPTPPAVVQNIYPQQVVQKNP